MEERKLTKSDIDRVRHIEGFPIAKDEDIIALSRPPYYTACPNPFIQDFIRENGTPYNEATDDYHREPFASDVSEGKSDALYNVHTYHTKVPPKAIAQYIMHFTDPGDVILDAFCGSGMTGVACAMTNGQHLEYRRELDPLDQYSRWGKRSVVLNDLSPVACFISHVYNLPRVKYREAQEEGTRILREFDETFGFLYETKHAPNGVQQISLDGTEAVGKINYIVWSDLVVCPSCGKELCFYDIGMDRKTGLKKKGDLICPFCGASSKASDFSKAVETYYDGVLQQPMQRVKEKPVLVNYSFGKAKYDKYLSEEEAIGMQLQGDNISLFPVPVVELKDGYNINQPKKSHLVNYVHQMYSERSLKVFAWLWNRASSVLDPDVKDLLCFSLQSICVGFSKMNRYFASSFSQVNRYLKGTLYISSIRSEVSPEYAWRGKLDKLSKLLANPSCMVTTGTATSLPIPDNSIDYIFIDPPFGANIMYSDLNIIWEAWLGVRTNTKEEAIVNEFQSKGNDDYSSLMATSLKEISRVLKPNHWITMEFHNSNNAIWNIIQTVMQEAHLVIADVRVLDKVQQTMKQFSTRGAVDKDLIISAYKPSESFTKAFSQHAGNAEMVWEFVRQHLQKVSIVADGNHDGKIDVISERQDYLLFDRMVAWHIMNGIPVPMDAHTFYEGLRQRFLERDGMFFLPDQVNEYDEKRAHMELEDQQTAFMVTDEKNAIAWLRYVLGNTPMTYQELQPLYMQELHQARQEKMPELMTMLKENFIQDERGAWYVPDMTNAADLAKVRRKALLKEFWDSCVPGKSKLKVFRLEAVRAGFDECWKQRDYKTIVSVGERLPEAVLQEDPSLLMYYDNACSRI